MAALGPTFPYLGWPRPRRLRHIGTAGLVFLARPIARYRWRIHSIPFHAASGSHALCELFPQLVGTVRLIGKIVQRPIGYEHILLTRHDTLTIQLRNMPKR